MNLHALIDPVVSFRGASAEWARGTIVDIAKKKLLIEMHGQQAITQAGEIIDELVIRVEGKDSYRGKAVVSSIVDAGLAKMLLISLVDEWKGADSEPMIMVSVANAARGFVQEWERRFQIDRGYQALVNELRCYLSNVSRWLVNVESSRNLPKEGERLRMDVFAELSAPVIAKAQGYFVELEDRAEKVSKEIEPVYQTYAQAILHPYVLGAPFAYRAYAKPLGYAGDYQMVNQIVDDPRQGANTYFQVVNAAFLQAGAAIAHRNRIDILTDFLGRLADQAARAARPFRVLNVGCGPAIEVQRFLEHHPNPGLLSFELLDFSETTLQWTRERLASIADSRGGNVSINYLQNSVQQLIKHPEEGRGDVARFDAVYCAGLFDYLSDKLCTRLMKYFIRHAAKGGKILITNVHSCNPEKRFVMEHLLEWYLIYRDESAMLALVPESTVNSRVYVDGTGVNVFAEATVA